MKFYFNGSPNPTKVALYLEEAGIPYEPIPVDTRKGDQFKPEFLALNPNGKVPVIDDDGVVMFDSNAILFYLAEKTGKFMPPPTMRPQMLSWLMFVASGIGPYNGQAVHFRHFAPERIEYAHKRYQFEAGRHYEILDQRLEGRAFVLGEYSFVDMAAWGWARMIPFVLGGEDAWKRFPHLKTWHDGIAERPAAHRALALKDKFAFKPAMDEEARTVMFRHLAT